ncbi:EF-hand domain-containing protein [Litoreibacter roseus]|uniref:EF-hand domain-containing protein n=1 Tax=Litoreibacter roseus TaxID=2601869 RepID=A0A6N6JGR0_9RHOB|nr:EF-hand domain-containing protein [Litoreibacter roseus]GFE65416.1 hypothetical protein KIN_24900 [Litoreibacter roseus]
MKHKTRAVLFLTAFAMATPAVVQAQGAAGKRASFEAMDADGNGELTRLELQAAQTRRITAADANGDDVLTRDEVLAHMQQSQSDRADRLFERRDADNDGRLTLAELEPDQNRSDRMFGRIDTNDDGVLSRAEFEAAQDARGRKRERRQN